VYLGDINSYDWLFKITEMLSPKFDFKDPWMSTVSLPIFSSFYESTFFNVSLGLWGKLFGDNQFSYLLVHYFSIFAGIVFFFISIYLFARRVLQKKINIFLIVASFSFGLGGLSNLIYSLFKGQSPFFVNNYLFYGLTSKEVTYEMIEGFGIFPLNFLSRTYRSWSLAFGFLFLFFLYNYFNSIVSRKKNCNFVIANISLLVSVIIYPNIGLTFYLVILILHITSYISIHYSKFRFRLLELLFVTVSTIIGLLPLLLSAAKNLSTVESYYIEDVLRKPLPIIVSILPGLCALLCLLYLDYRDKFIVTFVPLSLIYYSVVFYFGTKYTFGWLTDSNNIHTILLIFPSIPLLVWIIYYFFKKKFLQNEYIFFILWLVITLVLSIAPLRYLPIKPYHIIYTSFFPYTVLIVFAFRRFFDKYTSKMLLKKTLITLLVLVTSTSIIFYASFALNPAIKIYNNSFDLEDMGCNFLYKTEYNALKYISARDSGIVFSSARIGQLIPYLSGKESFNGYIGIRYPGLFERRNKDYYDFWNEKLNKDELYKYILKNNIRYIYYGVEEKMLDKDGIIFNYLANKYELIYKNEHVSIIKVF
jgi:hypothetical protein